MGAVGYLAGGAHLDWIAVSVKQHLGQVVNTRRFPVCSCGAVEGGACVVNASRFECVCGGDFRAVDVNGTVEECVEVSGNASLAFETSKELDATTPVPTTASGETETTDAHQVTSPSMAIGETEAETSELLDATTPALSTADGDFETSDEADTTTPVPGDFETSAELVATTTAPEDLETSEVAGATTPVPGDFETLEESVSTTPVQTQNCTGDLDCGDHGTSTPAEATSSSTTAEVSTSQESSTSTPALSSITTTPAPLTGGPPSEPMMSTITQRSASGGSTFGTRFAVTWRAPVDFGDGKAAGFGVWFQRIMV